MPFSFNPTVQAGSQEGGAQAPSTSLAPQVSPDISLNDAPTPPETPFLFLAQRGTGNITVNAYLQMLLLLISVISVIAALSLLAYGMYLTSSIESKKELLTAEESSFKEYPFTDMQKLSNRIVLVNQLLKDYVSIRSPLKLLEDVVENNAYFNNFTISREKKSGYVASFMVITTDYQSLIQQLESLKLTQYTKVAPQLRADGFSEDKKQNLTIKVTTPIIVQGVLPDEVVFLSSQEPKSEVPVTQEVKPSQ